MNTDLETVLSAHYLSLYVNTVADDNTHTGSSCENTTKVCKDKPIRHQEKLFSANLDNIKM